MRALVKLKAPEETLVQVSLEMTVREAKKVQEAFRDRCYTGAAAEMVGHIERAITRAEGTWDGTEPVADPHELPA